MNLRRINAVERTKIYGKLLLILIFIVFVLTIVPGYSETIKEARYTPLENKTCEEIYNASMTANLHTRNEKFGNYRAETVILYYLENCYQGGQQK